MLSVDLKCDALDLCIDLRQIFKKHEETPVLWSSGEGISSIGALEQLFDVNIFSMCAVCLMRVSELAAAFMNLEYILQQLKPGTFTHDAWPKTPRRSGAGRRSWTWRNAPGNRRKRHRRPAVGRGAASVGRNVGGMVWGSEKARIKKTHTHTCYSGFQGSMGSISGGSDPPLKDILGVVPFV